jgi:hypothetical protein
MSVSSDRIPHLLGLLGAALLLPWPSGKKGGWRKWKHLQLTDMDERSYQAKLERAANIGVALGQVSNGLVTIDLDHDTYVEAFLAANPAQGYAPDNRSARLQYLAAMRGWLPSIQKAKESLRARACVFRRSGRHRMSGRECVMPSHAKIIEASI